MLSPWELPERLGKRSDRPERASPVKEHREPIPFSIRESRNLGAPYPNAPKLIRVIRRRYAMTESAFERRDDGRFKSEHIERPPVGHPFREAVALIPQLEPREVTTRVRPEPRTRAPLDEWLNRRGQED